MNNNQPLEPLNIIDRDHGQPRSKVSKNCRPIVGVCLAVLSAALLVSSNLFAKLCVVIPVFELGVIRFMFQLLVTIPPIVYSNERLVYSPKITILLVLRGFGGTASMLTRFYASQNMPLGDATVLFFTTPVFVALFARVFLKEKLHWIYSVLVVLCLAGITLIARPTIIFGHPENAPEFDNILVPSIVALISSLSSAFNITVLRVLGKNRIASRSILFYSGIIGLICSILGGYFDRGMQFPFCKSIEYLYALAVGVVSTLGYVCVNEALRRDKAFIVSLARSAGLVFGFLFQIVIFSVLPSSLSFCGASMIALCNIVIFFFKWYQFKNDRDRQL